MCNICLSIGLFLFFLTDYHCATLWFLIVFFFLFSEKIQKNNVCCFLINRKDSLQNKVKQLEGLFGGKHYFIKYENVFMVKNIFNLCLYDSFWWFISDSVCKQNDQIAQLTKEKHKLERNIDDLQVL